MGVFGTFRNAFSNSHPCLEILILRIKNEGEVLSNLVIELADKQMGRVLSVRENGIQSYQDILKESNKEQVLITSVSSSDHSYLQFNLTL